MKKIVMTFALLMPAFSFAGEKLDIADLMTHREYKEAGLDKLSPEEVDSLNLWLEKFASTKADTAKNIPLDISRAVEKPEKGVISKLFNDPKSKTYTIQSAFKGSTFEINNRNFEASKLCSGFKKGDEVVFLEGSAYGLCSTAVFAKPGSSKTCKVWCEED